MIEKRQYERYQIPVDIQVESLVDGKPFTETTQLEDISIGGAMFSLNHKLPDPEINVDVVDENSDFANALGLDTSDSGPLRFSMDCKVLRQIQHPENPYARLIAVEFNGPLKIKRLRENNTIH